MRVRELVKEYPQPGGALRVLDGVNLELEAGQSLAITGPSGSGKTTLLSIVGALETPTSGSVEVAGMCVEKLTGRQLQLYRSRVVGIVFQEHRLLPQLTAIENVMLPTLAPDCRENQRNGLPLLERVGLKDWADAFPWQLSGGERQRVAIARALVNEPSLLLCDEPTGNLDRETGLKVADLLLELNQERHSALVVVTHNPEIAQRCARRMHLVGGRVQ